MASYSSSSEFAAFELAGWQRVAGRYEATWSGLTRQFIPPLLTAAGVRPGLRVLDVACGPGYVAEAAAGLGADATGVDFAPAMIELARRRNPTLTFRVDNAQALAEPNDSYDIVTINFGLLHLPHPQRGLEEAARVLRGGGRLAFTVWAGPAESPGARIVENAIHAHAEMNVPLPAGPDYYAFSTAAAATASLAAAGFRKESVDYQLITVRWTVPSADFLFLAERDAGVRTAGLLAHQTPAALEVIRAAIAEGVLQYRTAEGYAVPFSAAVVVAAV